MVAAVQVVSLHRWKQVAPVWPDKAIRAVVEAVQVDA